MSGYFFNRKWLMPALEALLITWNVSAVIPLRAQVFVVQNEQIDRRFSKIEPTQVALSSAKLNGRTRQELIRVLQAEQGFAMRPLPKGHKGLILKANGPLEPAGEEYLALMKTQGISSNPGDRVFLSDVKIEKDKIIIDINGGPDHKHRILRHVSIGANPNYTNPVAGGNDPDPTGSRITLVFPNGVPEMTGSQVKALLSPLLDFGLKTPVQAYTDTLPAVLRDAIREHRVLVGMTSQMVLLAKGQPDSKTREAEGKSQFEEWIYGQAPKDIEFIRIKGNRVTQVEIAKVGESVLVRNVDETAGTVPQPTRTIKMGDEQAGSENTSVRKAPPSLKRPGEKLPNEQDIPKMGPVQMPKDSSPDSKPQ